MLILVIRALSMISEHAFKLDSLNKTKPDAHSHQSERKNDRSRGKQGSVRLERMREEREAWLDQRERKLSKSYFAYRSYHFSGERRKSMIKRRKKIGALINSS